MTALYHQDFAAWTREQADFARRGCVNALDIQNIAEELDSMGKLESRALAGQIRRLASHLLKWCYCPTQREAILKVAIFDARVQIEDILRDSPSLAGEWDEMLADEWPRAVRRTAYEVGIALRAFPKDPTWDRPELLDPDFLPDCE